MKKVLFLMVILMMVNNPVQSQVDKPIVLATTSVLGDIVKEIAGDSVTIDVIIPDGTDIHDYQPVASDTQLLNDADIVFYFGDGVEELLESSLDNLGDKSIKLMDVIPVSLKIANEGHVDEYDPHVWLSLNVMIPVVEKIGLELRTRFNIDLDNFHTDAYIAEMEMVNTEIIDKLSDVSQGQRFLVTIHNAFQYFAKEYNFNTKSIIGVSTLDEGGIADIDSTASFLIDNKVKVIFTEVGISQELVKSVIDAAYAQGWEVVVGGELSVNYIGTNNNYLGMLLDNAYILSEGILNPPSFTTDTPFDIKIILYMIIILPLIRIMRKKKNGY